MPSAEANVATDRASRYLVQLCKHLNNQGRHLRHRPRSHQPGGGAEAEHPAFRARLKWDDNDATIEFDQGRCSIHASADTLAIHAEADDAQALEHIERLISDHLARFSRRSPLTVRWEPLEDGDTRTEISS
jgi:hypothetical protein